MLYDFTVDPVTKKKIVVFNCSVANGFPKNGFALAKNYFSWEYYQGNNIWHFFKAETSKIFDTQEEAQLACTQYLDFLKECGF